MAEDFDVDQWLSEQTVESMPFWSLNLVDAYLKLKTRLKMTLEENSRLSDALETMRSHNLTLPVLTKMDKDDEVARLTPSPETVTATSEAIRILKDIAEREKKVVEDVESRL